jgi:rhodanese-related sulfurtransferase
MYKRSLLVSLLLLPSLGLAQAQAATDTSVRPSEAGATVIELQGVPADEVPPHKQTDQALYITASQAYRLQQMHPREVVLLDIRNRAEVVYAGQPESVDAHVPYLELAYPLTWNPRTNDWRTERNPAFVADVEAALTRLGADKNRPILLLCRSGMRSAVAADALAAAGFSRVYTVVDGFEGDLGASGRRDVNGWKNAGAPWRASPVARVVYGTQP